VLIGSARHVDLLLGSPHIDKGEGTKLQDINLLSRSD
jgi:hypothetical protein